jgi:hypothetical protein
VFAIVDFAKEYVIRFRLRELLASRGWNVGAGDYVVARQLRELCGVPDSVGKRLLRNESKGVDNVTLMRLSLGIGCAIGDLFEIDVVDDENDENARNGESE